MNKTIIINRRTPINLKDISVIEKLSSGELDKLAARYEGEAADYAAFNSAVRLIGGTTKLAVQSISDLIGLANGRVLNLSAPSEDGSTNMSGPLVPIDAIRHLEPVSEEERAAMKQSYGDVDPEVIEAKRMRIVYRALDPANPQRYFQKTFAADILDDLMDRDRGFLVDIGNGKYVLADEIVDACPLSDKQINRLSRKYALTARSGEALITSITLTDDEFILSSLPAQQIEALVERPLPSLNIEQPVRKGKSKPAAAKAEPALG